MRGEQAQREEIRIPNFPRAKENVWLQKLRISAPEAENFFVFAGNILHLLVCN